MAGDLDLGLSHVKSENLRGSESTIILQSLTQAHILEITLQDSHNLSLSLSHTHSGNNATILTQSRKYILVITLQASHNFSPTHILVIKLQDSHSQSPTHTHTHTHTHPGNNATRLTITRLLAGNSKFPVLLSYIFT